MIILVLAGDTGVQPSKAHDPPQGIVSERSVASAATLQCHVHGNSGRGSVSPGSKGQIRNVNAPLPEGAFVSSRQGFRSKDSLACHVIGRGMFVMGPDA